PGGLPAVRRGARHHPHRPRHEPRVAGAAARPVRQRRHAHQQGPRGAGPAAGRRRGQGRRGMTLAMHLPSLAAVLLGWARERYIGARDPDFIIGADAEGGPYLLRWYVTPWRRWKEHAEHRPTWWNQAKARVSRLLPNLYVHVFLRDDDDRALHDHPSWA